MRGLGYRCLKSKLTVAGDGLANVVFASCQSIRSYVSSGIQDARTSAEEGIPGMTGMHDRHRWPFAACS